MEQRLNTTQAAEFLKDLGVAFSRGTLEVWRCQGRGPRYRKLGRRVFYCPSDLQEFASGQLVETIDSYER